MREHTETERLAPVSDKDWMDELNAESERTMAMAAGMLGLTQQEVLARVDTSPGGYRLYFIEEGTDSGIRTADFNARRVYFVTRNGTVVGYDG